MRTNRISNPNAASCRKPWYKSLRRLAPAACLALTAVSCVDTDSSLVDFGSSLGQATDTVYSLLGILGKMQVVADRTVVLGEVRGDLTTVTDAAASDLRTLADFTATASNSWNAAADYYAVIQNCNYYIAHADTSLSVRGEKVFEREFAAIKTFRAWAYLQLAIHYGEVPFYTEPLMAESEADPSLYPRYDVVDVANYFIDDLADYVETDFPSLGTSYDRCFIPVRVMLGDLCLWAGRYDEAAAYYHAFLTHTDNPLPVQTHSVEWSDYNFEQVTSDWETNLWDSDESLLSQILMEESEYDGLMSGLDDLFSSTTDNKYYYQLEGSAALSELSASQRYVLVYTNPTTSLPDTVSPPDVMDVTDSRLYGDLRYYRTMTRRNSSGNDSYSSSMQECNKLSASAVMLYRVGSVYLRMAEAYNRAGLPETAFAILKYGLYNDVINNYIHADEVNRAGDLLTWSRYTFTSDNTQGIHSNGSGSADADTTYVIPALSTREDSILYVEDKICDEMALEQAFEGQRFGDLMRISLHRGDATFLAGKIAGRGGASNFDNDLYTRLCDKSNWFLPLE